MLSVSETSPGRVVFGGVHITDNVKSDGFAFPGVCSPVEAGEVARVAGRRGGDLPRGLRYAQDDGICIFTITIKSKPADKEQLLFIRGFYKRREIVSFGVKYRA